MNHVGKQVKTVTTHTLLIAGSEARASAGPHERPHLSPRGDPAPKENGKGQPIDKDGSATSLRADGEVWRCDQLSAGAGTGPLVERWRDREEQHCRKSWLKKSMAATGIPGAKGWSGSFAKIKSSSALKKSGGCDG